MRKAIIIGTIIIFSLLVAGCDDGFSSCIKYCADTHPGCTSNSFDGTIVCPEGDENITEVKAECFDKCSGQK